MIDIHFLPRIPAVIDTAAVVVLLASYWFIQHGDRERHRIGMLIAAAPGAAFLAVYLTYQRRAGEGRRIRYDPADLFHAAGGSCPNGFGGWIYSAVADWRVERNPWCSKSLEWTHASFPVRLGNFDEPVTMRADWTPYNCGK